MGAWGGASCLESGSLSDCWLLLNQRVRRHQGFFFFSPHPLTKHTEEVAEEQWRCESLPLGLYKLLKELTCVLWPSFLCPLSHHIWQVIKAPVNIGPTPAFSHSIWNANLVKHDRHIKKHDWRLWHLPRPDLTWKAMWVSLLALSLSSHWNLWGRPDSWVYGWNTERGRDSGSLSVHLVQRDTRGGDTRRWESCSFGNFLNPDRRSFETFLCRMGRIAVFPDEWAGEIQPAKWTEGRLWNWQAGVWLYVLLFTNWVMGKLIAFAFLLLCDSYLFFPQVLAWYVKTI